MTRAASDHLGGFVGFKAQVQAVMRLSSRFIDQGAVAEHQVVVRLQIFRVNTQYRFQVVARRLVLPQQKR